MGPLPRTIKECDQRLETCRLTLDKMQVRSSRLIVWQEIDELLDRRARLSRRRSTATA